MTQTANRPEDGTSGSDLRTRLVAIMTVAAEPFEVRRGSKPDTWEVHGSDGSWRAITTDELHTIKLVFTVAAVAIDARIKKSLGKSVDKSLDQRARRRIAKAMISTIDKVMAEGRRP